MEIEGLGANPATVTTRIARRKRVDFIFDGGSLFVLVGFVWGRRHI